MAAILPINPEVGLALLLPAFAVIVLGSIGSMPGVIIGAVIVGLLRAASEPILIGAGGALDRPTASGFAQVVPFVLLVGILLLAPRGIGSAIQSWNIERIRKGRLNARNRATDPASTSSVIAATTWARFAAYTEQMVDIKDQVITLLSRLIWAALLLPRIGFGLGAAGNKYLTSRISQFGTQVRRALGNWVLFDRSTERGSWFAFFLFLLILAAIVFLLPSVSNLAKTMQVARIVTLVGIFGLAALSLNLHTGITGMTNFGVIFFVGLGAVVVGLLAAPIDTGGYGWNPLVATVLALFVAAVAGWLLAYPTARLRMDYFAIVTISLGEMLRISLQAEPLLRAGSVTSAIGISQFARPLDIWWENGPAVAIGRTLGLDGQPRTLCF